MTSTPRFTMPAAMRLRLLKTLDGLDLKLAAAQAGRTGQRTGNMPIWLRRTAASLAGLALIVAGVPMLVLPGPGVLAILLGLSLLAGQFSWARRLLASLTSWARRALASIPTSGAPA